VLCTKILEVHTSTYKITMIPSLVKPSSAN
jgi:hypothetical protein